MDYAWQGPWTYTGWYEPFTPKQPGLFGTHFRMQFKWVIRLEEVSK